MTRTHRHVLHTLLIVAIILILFFILGEKSFEEVTQYIPEHTTQTAAVADFNSSLIAYYTFDGNTADSAGSNSGTASGGPTYVAGKIGQALQFDGVDDVVNLGSGTGLTNPELQNGGMTIAFWFNPSALANRTVLTKGTGSGSPLNISLNSSGRLSFFRKYDGATHLNVRFNDQAAANEWRHFVFTWNGGPNVSDVKLYRNGSLQTGGGDSGAGNKIADDTSFSLYLGYPTPNAGVAGAFDDFRIYNRVLNPQEIGELYAYAGGGSGGGVTQSSGDTQAPSPVQSPTTYTLTVSKAGTGSGTVTGGSISCGSTCTQGAIVTGDQITLSASPSGSDTFTGWSGGGCSGTGNCSLSISANTTVTATFAAPVTPSPSGICAPTNIRCVGQGQEYPTIQACATATVAGDTCLVYPGTYSERVNVNRDGASGNPITYLAKEGVTACGFDFTNSDYVRVIGFTLDTNAGSCTMAQADVVLSGTNTYLELWDNTFRDALYNGIRIGVNDFIHNSVIIGNTFSNFGVGNGSGMAVGIQGDNNLISYNELYNTHPDGFMMFGSNNRWTNNYTHDFSEASGGHSDLFQTGSRPSGWHNNLIEANFQAGMGNSGDEHVAQISNGQAAAYCPTGCGAMTENIFRNNVWNNISSGTVGINQSFDGPITHIRYYNNTTADASVKYPDNKYGLSWYHSGTNYGYLFNNIEYESWGSSVTSGIGVYCLARDTSCDPSAGAGFTYGMDYNLAYDPQGSVSFISPWTSQSHAKSNVNPQFISFSSKDFHLNANSPAIGGAGNLTTVSQSGSNVSTISVADGGFFRGDNTALNQYGGNLVVGDLITIGTGANADTRRISTVSGNSITLTSPVTVVQGEPVYWSDDSTPDIGAFPYKSNGYGIVSSLNVHDSNVLLRGSNTLAMTVNDSSLVRFVEFYIDGMLVWVDADAPYTYSWNTSGEANGTTHTVKAVARPRYASMILKYEDQAFVTVGDAGTSPVVPPVNDPPPTITPEVPAPPTQPSSADFNHDGLVNTLDFSALVSFWNRSSTTHDLNHDGIVNTLDYSILAQQWSR